MAKKTNKFNLRSQLMPPEEKGKTCFFCSSNIKWIDYKDTAFLRRFVSMQAKVVPVRRTGTCAKHQRMLAQSIKRARYLALMPYTVNKDANFIK